MIFWERVNSNSTQIPSSFGRHGIQRLNKNGKGDSIMQTQTIEQIKDYMAEAG